MTTQTRQIAAVARTRLLLAAVEAARREIADTLATLDLEDHAVDGEYPDPEADPAGAEHAARGALLAVEAMSARLQPIVALLQTR